MVVVSAGGITMSQLLHEAVEVARPTGCDRRSAKGIFEGQVPADDPCDKLAQSGIAVGVGRAGNGNDGGKLRVAQSCKRAGQSGENEAECDCRPRMQCSGLAREREDARADDGADAQGD